MRMREFMDLVESAGSSETFDQFVDELRSSGIAPIEELQSAKSHAAQSFSTKQEFVNYMSKMGFKCIGAGALGIVFAHPKLNYVLKVYENDQGYDDFVKLAMQYQGNPHFPKIYGKIIAVTRSTKMIRTERLQPMRPNEFAKTGGADSIWREIRNGVDGDLGDFEGEALQLANAFMIVLKYGRSKAMQMDIHSGNVMKRGNTVVIIDPYVDRSWDDEERTDRGGLDWGYQGTEPPR